MSVWLVKATWTEDEAEASEQWEVNADTAHDAVGATSRLRFHPITPNRRCSPEDEDKARAVDLLPGGVRRIRRNDPEAE
jgi:hypothetical protein